MQKITIVKKAQSDRQDPPPTRACPWVIEDFGAPQR